METLHSIHPIEIEPGGLGTTVRRGRKWYDADVTDGIELCECTLQSNSQCESHRIVGHGRLMARALLDFNSLTDAMLENEHEVSSRTVEGLFASMQRAYGSEFTWRERVTLLTYWRTD